MSSPDPIDALARFAGMRRSAILVGVWAFGEAIILPVVPDVALALLALAAPRRAAPLFVTVVVGALAGSLVLAALTVAAPQEVEAMLDALPAVDAATFAAADAELEARGVAGFAQFGPGPPLKVYTAEWVADGGGAAGLIVGVALNRLTRIGPVMLVARLAGWLLAGWIRRHGRAVVAGYAVAWTAFYVVYWASA